MALSLVLNVQSHADCPILRASAFLPARLIPRSSPLPTPEVLPGTRMAVVCETATSSIPSRRNARVGRPVSTKVLKQTRTRKGDAMITMTPTAEQKIRELMQEAKETVGLRVFVKGG